MSVAVVNRQLKQVPQYTRVARHRRALLQHGTPRKWANYALAKIERRLHKIRVRSVPHLMVIDPCNYCNLRCPLCPTGIGQLYNTQAMLSLAHFQTYLDVLADYLFEVYLYNWGESLLNPAVYDMIRYAQNRNVGTNLSSNFVDVSSRNIDNLLNSRLEYLVVSLDGTSQETYGKYRVRGIYDNVLSSMDELIRRRNRRGQKTPVVEWQFIVMKHNEHEVREAELLAKQVGVDLLRFIPVALQVLDAPREELAEKWFPKNFRGRTQDGAFETAQQFGQANKPSPCFYLYDTMTVNPNGGVHPCCVVYKQDTEFGRFPLGNVQSFWNNPSYQSARSLFSKRDPFSKVAVTCDGCDIFEKYPKPVAVTDQLVQLVPVRQEETFSE